MWPSLRRLKAAGLGCAAALAAIVVAAGGAPLWTHYSPVAGQMGDRLLPPLTRGHLAGTDSLGRDVLTRIMYGTRVSLEVALTSVLGAGLVGSTLGVTAGYGGGWLDLVIMRFVDVQLSFPFIVLALAVAGILGPSFANIVLTLIISRWVIYARLARGQVLVERERLYVQAAQAVGASGRRILTRHILPNILAAIVVMGSLETGRMVLSEAAISFLGFGVQAPQPSLGSMVAEGRDYLYSAWWLTTAPGAVVLVVSLLANLLGDAVHDALERP